MAASPLLKNPVFAQAVAEIESLGFRVLDRATPGALPYMVIGGRSNQRWWLVPLANRNVAANGLAMFQPVITSAKLLKWGGTLANSLGLAGLWARRKVYIAGNSGLADIFGGNDHHYGFFTGTNSPHRKLAVQIMDEVGNIRGFAKVACNKSVKPLLVHEAATLKYVRSLDLRSAHIPNVLFSGEIGNAGILVTDTLKTPRTRSASTLQSAHLAFLEELAIKTASVHPEGASWLTESLRGRYALVAGRLSQQWKTRLETAIARIAEQKQCAGPSVMRHGDFTPWNTFLADGTLYVFDWEYSGHDYPLGHDAIHFLMSSPKIRKKPADVQIRTVIQHFCKAQSLDSAYASTLLRAYLCSHAMHYAEREQAIPGRTVTWDGEVDTAALLDHLAVPP